MRKARYQKGCVSLSVNGSGEPVWIFRWRETLPDSRCVARKKQIGLVERYPSKTAAERAVAGLRLAINAERPGDHKAITMEMLVQHYRETELIDNGEEGKAYSTRDRYDSCLSRWITPRWGDYRLSDVKTIAVEQWLRKIDRANATKARIRNLMSALFNHGIRWEFTDRNPITGPVRGSGVRQSSKRERIPEILEVEEMRALLAELALRERVLVFLDMATGLRRGELAGLQWRDVDFQNLLLRVERSVVDLVVGKCKTEASKKPVPLDEYLAQDLFEWYQHAPCIRPEDWIFASTSNRAGKNRGQHPLCLSSIMRYHIQPAAIRAGIMKKVSWHTFRHTFSTLLKANGEDVKTVQELLRHASTRITLDVYTQAVTPAKRYAQSKVIAMIRPKNKRNCVPESAPKDFGANPVSA